ncbi:MAG: HlyD family efflux transporter periplasmic adaptor subunit, partial [Oscillochloris sp.]|nr:HlyD family efflux transporter periplasmic adaptor subunit [Oscillochloris sp.]
RLRGERRRGEILSAEATVREAQATLDSLLAGPDSSDLALSQARMRIAEHELALADLSLDSATLIAPFDGSVAQLNLVVGERVDPNSPHVMLVDPSLFYVDVTVDELDVVQIRPGQPGTLSLDALPDRPLDGIVQQVSLLSGGDSGVAAYLVRVQVTGDLSDLRSGMSATALIEVDRRNNALVLPRRAIEREGAETFVRVLNDPAFCNLPAAERPPAPEWSRVAVELGRSSQSTIEIIGGIDERACVYIADQSVVTDPLSVPLPGTR